MRLSQIRQIIEIEKCGSVTQAAKQLYIAQPSLSATLTEFEEEIGVKLFHRSKQGISLTPEGENILPVMKQIIRQVDFIKNYNGERDEQEITGNIRFTIGPAVDFLYGEFLQNAKNRFPKANIQISYNVTSSILSELNRNIIDFSISALEGVNNHNLSEQELCNWLPKHFPEIVFIPLKKVYTIAIFKKKFFPKLSDLIVLENLVDTQLILGDPYSANQFELCLKLEKYPMSNLDWYTVIDLIQRIPVIFLNATPLSIEQYRSLHNLKDDSIAIVPMTTNIAELELSWPIYLFHKKNIHRQLEKGILEEMLALLKKHDLMIS